VSVEMGMTHGAKGGCELANNPDFDLQDTVLELI
jgi:hypothetical protein